MEQHFTGLPSPCRDRMVKDLAWLSEQRDSGFDGWTRLSFTELYRDTRRRLAEKMEAAGMTVRRDAAANLIGRLEGAEADLPPLVTGSHTDTVRNGGRYDGIIGVLAGIEAARLITREGLRLRHPLEVIDFTAEEPTVFGISTIGSKALAGVLTQDMLERTDPQGRTLAEALAEADGIPEDIPKTARKPGDMAAFLELHIEQGPVLEREGQSIGLVTGIVGIDRFEIRIDGRADHAGTTPMDRRRDALAGASEVILALEGVCRTAGKPGLVGTVGRLLTEPNASNVVTGRVILDAEIRSPDPRQAGSAAEAFRVKSEELCRQRGLECAFRQISHTEPVKVPDDIVSILQTAGESAGAGWMEIVSGAGHDANLMATIAPAGMIFVPSVGGRSHCPEEYTRMEDILRGTEVLLRSILLLDGRRDGKHV